MKRKAAAVRTLKQARTYMGSMAAIVFWNTVYLDRAVQALRKRGQMIPEALLVHLSPLKWEHINMTGDYHWRRDGGLRNRKSRPLRNALA